MWGSSFELGMGMQRFGMVMQRFGMVMQRL
ncbi:hypothetical protein SAMN05428953_102134 [Mesorhizobium muleiense]|uniref:Uncharacterized protein n=1 Tax=Mesorhizobium muleiense TaxID=1004279 RepID=A0A1G8L4C3_9HYPH|nr:hypothetical protein SAMN05428953_102134 [Mesorhizobium muleiense]